ncbi:hypothetical protein ACLOJK_029616 [Asimina triloba]
MPRTLRLARRLRLKRVKGRLMGTDHMPSIISWKQCTSCSLCVPRSSPNRSEQMMSNVSDFIRGRPDRCRRDDNQECSGHDPSHGELINGDGYSLTVVKTRQGARSRGRIRHWLAGRKKRFEEKEINSSSPSREIRKWRRGEGISVLIGREEEEIEGEGEGGRILVTGNRDGKMTTKRRQIDAGW